MQLIYSFKKFDQNKNFFERDRKNFRKSEILGQRQEIFLAKQIVLGTEYEHQMQKKV